MHPETSESTLSSNPSIPEKKISSAKHERTIVHDFESQCKEIRSQLSEQLKCIAERTEVQVTVLAELEEFVKKRAEAEADHSKALEKLAKNVMQRHKNEKHKRDPWLQHATCTAWQQLVDDTKAEADQKSKLATLLAKKIAPSIVSRAEDLQRVSKKCREMGALAHSEMNRVLNELQTAMRTYHIVHSEWNVAERKMRIAAEERRKCEESSKGGKNGIGRKHRNAIKAFNKREEKLSEVSLRTNKARNEYILCIHAANSALHKFYADDLSALVDAADLGMDFWLQATLGCMADARKESAVREMSAVGELQLLRDSLDSKADKQKFFESRNTVFMLPRPFEFRPAVADNEANLKADEALAGELLQRQRQIEKRLEGLRFESDEVWKSLEACQKQILQLYSMEGTEEAPTHKWRHDLAVSMNYYLKKFEYFLLNGNLIERLETRSRTLGQALAESGMVNGSGIGTIGKENGKNRKRLRRTLPITGTKPRPKLFGSSLEEYVERSGEEIPLVVVSTISFLSRFALRHQGLFRISGSTSEINRFKEAFENGEDVVSDLPDGSEANSVAGVLKMYLRELREPPFPLYLFDQLTDSVKSAPTEFVDRIRLLLARLPPSSLRLLRYLFGFLAHLCEFSDENMMEPHNVAICLGPTLLPIPEGKDQVFYHNFVNELVRALIVHWEEVFPSADELSGPLYDKYAHAREEMVSCAEEIDGEEEETDVEMEEGPYENGAVYSNSNTRMSAPSISSVAPSISSVAPSLSSAAPSANISLSSRCSMQSSVGGFVHPSDPPPPPVLSSSGLIQSLHVTSARSASGGGHQQGLAASDRIRILSCSPDSRPAEALPNSSMSRPFWDHNPQVQSPHLFSLREQLQMHNKRGGDGERTKTLPSELRGELKRRLADREPPPDLLRESVGVKAPPSTASSPTSAPDASILPPHMPALTQLAQITQLSSPISLKSSALSTASSHAVAGQRAGSPQLDELQAMLESLNNNHD